MTPDHDAPRAELMQIGEVAERTELSIRSLRHWEDVGLLRPSHRTDGGFRLYTEADVEKILTIRRMKPLGFTLEQMRETLDDVETRSDPAAAPAEREDARLRLVAIREDAAQRRRKLARQTEMADEFLGLIAEHTR